MPDLHKRKKPGPEDGPGKCWLVARINLWINMGLKPLLGCSYVNAALKGRSSTLLCASTRPYRQIPHLGQDARHLHPVQLRHERQQLGDELIFH